VGAETIPSGDEPLYTLLPDYAHLVEYVIDSLIP
jgi:hypothetical protein